ncbi:MAG: hypothetical protein M1821_004093 [Bathelium mastoideum]|nr:MAG: hypothetical protein M1821_004093 [Bathelium mastoideum]
MEAAGAGASVLSFLTLALSSAKAIHNVLSAIRHGPKHIQNLANSVVQLQKTLERLERLSQCQAHSIDGLYSTELKDLVKNCAADSANIDRKLRRLDLAVDIKRVGKLWRRLKVFIYEKDLEHMRNIIQCHNTALSAHVSVALFAQSSFSVAQSTEIFEILKQIKSEVAVSRLLQTPSNYETLFSRDPDEVATRNDVHAIRKTDTTLEDSISRLMELVDEKECTVESDEALQLINDLQTLLDSAQRSSLSETRTKHHRTCKGETTLHVSRELKLANSLICSASSIAINGHASIGFIAPLPSGAMLRQQRKRKDIDFESGTLTIATNKRQQCQILPYQTTTIDDSSREREFIAQLVFKPKNLRSMLTISVNQLQTLQGGFLSIPRLSVNNILPKDALVFKVAAGGQVEQLKSLLAEGKASLRDHDTNGWSLLHTWTSSLRKIENIGMMAIVGDASALHSKISVENDNRSAKRGRDSGSGSDSTKSRRRPNR